MIYGIDIKSLRKSRRITQAGLGLLCGMNKSQISRMEKGTLGSPETINRVLLALGYSIKLEIVDLQPDSVDVVNRLVLYKKYNSSKYGISKLGVFGSAARNELRPDSDIDICILLKSPSLYKYSEIQRDLRSLFGREIDLIPLNTRMSDDFANELKKDVIYV